MQRNPRRAEALGNGNQVDVSDIARDGFFRLPTAVARDGNGALPEATTFIIVGSFDEHAN